jgi:hypothetical protein
MREQPAVVGFLAAQRKNIAEFMQGGTALQQYPWTSTRSDKNHGWNIVTVDVMDPSQRR